MDIGKENDVITIEPVEVPVPARPEEDPAPAPDRVPAKV
jgi:hypothetical protein